MNKKKILRIYFVATLSKSKEEKKQNEIFENVNLSSLREGDD